MGLEPDLFVNKFMDFQKKKKKKKKLVNEFVEETTTINEIFKKQMNFVQIQYENFENKHK